jgi:hypothetical protein
MFHGSRIERLRNIAGQATGRQGGSKRDLEFCHWDGISLLCRSRRFRMSEIFRRSEKLITFFYHSKTSDPAVYSFAEPLRRFAKELVQPAWNTA